VALPLEFTVNPDSKKPGFLDWGDRLLAKANWRRGRCVYTGKVDKFTLLWGKLHPSCSSPLATDLPGAFEVSASRLCILTEGQEVQVVGEADCYETSLVVELSVETRGVEEEEDRREWWSLWYSSSDVVWERRLSVEEQASCTAVEEATNPPDDPGGEALGLEGVE
jgi:hypothetical protein